MAVSSFKIKENKKLVKLGYYMQVLLAHGNSLLVNVYIPEHIHVVKKNKKIV